MYNDCIKALLLFGAICGIAHSEGLAKVWEIDLNELASPRLGVFTLSFSPDGRRILSVLGASREHQFSVILDADNPNHKRRVEISPGVSEDEPYGVNAVDWSPDGHHLTIANRLLDLDDEKSRCSPGGRFVNANQHVSVFRENNAGPTGLGLFDLECRLISVLSENSVVHGSPGEWLFRSASAEAGLMTRESYDVLFNFVKGPVTIVHAAGLRTVRSLPPAYSGAFADRGRVACTTGGEPRRRSVDCWDIATGARLATRATQSYSEITPAAGAKRVVISEYGRIVDFIDWRWAMGTLKKREVWDFGIGRIVASWSPGLMKVHTISTPHPDRQPLRFAISPDGAYIAEGGDGKITLYAISPVGH